MWYGSGTITVAANGTNATGTGTQFLGNVRVGDGIAIQGSASLHEVTGVTSNAQLTFAPPYAGTAGSGKAYRVAPVLGYDKDLSDAFNQLRLQFGEQLSSLQPWATAPTLDAAQTAFGMSASGKAVAGGTPAQGRDALGLGSAAVRNATTSGDDYTAGRLVRVGDYGLPTAGGMAVIKKSGGSGSGDLDDVVHPGWLPSLVGENYTNKPASYGYLQVLQHDSRVSQIWYPYSAGSGARSIFWRTRGTGANPWSDWFQVWDSRATTIDSNGFLKSASPIIRLHSDRIDINNQASGGAFEKLDVGYYEIRNCNGLRLNDGWYIETPHDKNGNKYFNVDWEQDRTPETDAGILDEPADVTLTIRCYERVWNPQTGQYDNGDPVDIPDGRWIDLRLNEVRQPEPEMPEEPETPQQPSEPGAPVIPYSVTKAQGKAALIQAGLWQAVMDYVAGIEDATERMLAEIALHDAQDYRRDSPFLNATADALGLTEERKDELFILASNILL